MKIWRDRRGATAIEYGLIASLIACTMIVGVNAFGGALSNTLLFLSSRMPAS